MIGCREDFYMLAIWVWVCVSVSLSVSVSVFIYIHTHIHICYLRADGRINAGDILIESTYIYIHIDVLLLIYILRWAHQCWRHFNSR